MARYMLLLHRHADRPMPSREEMAEIVRRYTAWGDALAAEGKVVGRDKLAPVANARCVRLQDGKPLITDGPYPEVKDVIGGYYILETEDIREAEAIARDCPHLWDTNWVELRPIDDTAMSAARASVDSGATRTSMR